MLERLPHGDLTGPFHQVVPDHFGQQIAQFVGQADAAFVHQLQQYRAHHRLGL
nr:hypothetical protein [Spongiactinospora gelatinilytica]